MLKLVAYLTAHSRLHVHKYWARKSIVVLQSYVWHVVVGNRSDRITWFNLCLTIILLLNWFSLNDFRKSLMVLDVDVVFRSVCSSSLKCRCMMAGWIESVWHCRLINMEINNHLQPFKMCVCNLCMANCMWITYTMNRIVRPALEVNGWMTFDAEVDPRAALLLGTPLETEWETPISIRFIFSCSYYTKILHRHIMNDIKIYLLNVVYEFCVNFIKYIIWPIFIRLGMLNWFIWLGMSEHTV